jgi:hypothetical protein
MKDAFLTLNSRDLCGNRFPCNYVHSNPPTYAMNKRDPLQVLLLLLLCHRTDILEYRGSMRQ